MFNILYETIFFFFFLFQKYETRVLLFNNLSIRCINLHPYYLNRISKFNLSFKKMMYDYIIKYPRLDYKSFLSMYWITAIRDELCFVFDRHARWPGQTIRYYDPAL